ncbi:MAG: riboflavin synthase [Lachnospiraceae bacterium]|nr:riboflavin synthase [Lachnospiraceae bacterium]MBR0402793.1 riboflavin synthase [Lachnospiraceae bacterium]MBR2737321.1 riboflavin synthase [Lachnospiraceae bacterium]
MFTGIIEEIGTIENIRRGANSAVLTIGAETVLSDCHVGDSIAVNGICLTVTGFTPRAFTADAMHETLDRTSLRMLRPGSPVNLERAMAANGRFGGHIVSGHIDGVGTIAGIRRDDNAVIYTVEASPEILAGIVEKGSIAIDGISLTVVSVDDRCFTVSIIPHTAGNTILSTKKAGDPVNLENDIIGKYVAKLLAGGMPTIYDAANGRSAGNSRGIDAGFLAENGFI